MAKKEKKPRLAPENGPHGIDRWSGNGYGLRLNGEPVEPLPDTVFGDLDEDYDVVEDTNEG